MIWCQGLDWQLWINYDYSCWRNISNDFNFFVRIKKFASMITMFVAMICLGGKSRPCVMALEKTPNTHELQIVSYIMLQCLAGKCSGGANGLVDVGENRDYFLSIAHCCRYEFRRAREHSVPSFYLRNNRFLCREANVTFGK